MSCFDVDAIDVVRAASSAVDTALLLLSRRPAEELLDRAVRHDHAIVHPYDTMVDATFMDAARSRGLSVNVWFGEDVRPRGWASSSTSAWTGSSPPRSPTPPRRRARGAVRRGLEWLFRDRRTGEVVIAQWPNLPLIVFLGASVAKRFLDPSGRFGTALTVVVLGIAAVVGR